MKDSGMSDLVSLLYRADWTRLSLTAEVGVSRDHDLSRSRFESGAPQPPPLGVPWGVPWSVPWRGGPWSGPSSGPEREMAADVPGPEEGRSTVLIAPGRRYRQQGG